MLVRAHLAPRAPRDEELQSSPSMSCYDDPIVRLLRLDDVATVLFARDRHTADAKRLLVAVSCWLRWAVHTLSSATELHKPNVGGRGRVCGVHEQC